MPTYEYRCEKGHEFEVFQRMSEPPVEKCVQCGAAAERLMSAGSGLIFKGSGFYITDYARSESYKKAAESDKGAATPSTPSTPSSTPAPATPAASAAPATPSKSADTGSSKSSGSSGSE